MTQIVKRVYLDHAATTPLDERVFEAMKPYFTSKFGNASSIHAFGQEAKAALDESREVIARAIGASAGEVIFTGSGTEADNYALKGTAFARRKLSGKSHIITSAGEHHAVLETCRYLEGEGFTVTYLPISPGGTVSAADVREAITGSTALISIIHANNEIGTINPIPVIGSIAREHGIPFHTDAVQSFGKIEVNVASLGVDLLSLSAHKIYGPKGIGALYIRKASRLENLIHGGAQERGRRGGTENVPLAAGFARAATIALGEMDAERLRLTTLRNGFAHLLSSRFPSIIVNGSDDPAYPYILNVSFDNKKIRIDGEALLFNLDLAGVAVTSGSACTSGNAEPSHVLLSLGRDPATAKASVRFSMGKSSRCEEIGEVVNLLEGIVDRIGVVPA